MPSFIGDEGGIQRCSRRGFGLSDAVNNFVVRCPMEFFFCPLNVNVRCPLLYMRCGRCFHSSILLQFLLYRYTIASILDLNTCRVISCHTIRIRLLWSSTRAVRIARTVICEVVLNRSPAIPGNHAVKLTAPSSAYLTDSYARILSWTCCKASWNNAPIRSPRASRATEIFDADLHAVLREDVQHRAKLGSQVSSLMKSMYAYR